MLRLSLNMQCLSAICEHCKSVAIGVSCPVVHPQSFTTKGVPMSQEFGEAHFRCTT